MFNLKKKTRGAISVFLTLILVPCIVIACLFVDAGRIMTSKSMATSAADLALDSLLTNYDADLNEWYGMVASCQSIEEFYEVSAKFFLRTLSSQGLSDDEIKNLSDYYADATSDDTIYDFLKVDVDEDSGVKITAVGNANLTNATFIKEQTLEFMKYRAPIELVSGLISRLSSDSSLNDATQAEENEELVSEKQDFYEADGELRAAAYKIYCALYEYYEMVDSNGMSLSKLQEYAQGLADYESAYEKIHNLMVSNLYNTGSLSTYSRVTMSLSAYMSDSSCTYKSANVYSRREIEGGAYVYYITEEKAKDLLDDLEEKAEACAEAIYDFVDAADAEGLLDTLPGSSDSDAYGIQWWVKMNAAVNSGNGPTAKLQTAAQNLLKAYARVINMESCIIKLEGSTASDEEDAENNTDNWITFRDTYYYTSSNGTQSYSYDELLTIVTNIQSQYLTAGKVNASDDYLVLVNELETVSSENANNIKSSTLMVSIDGTNMTIDNAIPYLQQKISAIRSELSGYVEQLGTVIDGDADAGIESLDSLVSLLETYQTELGEWSAEADEGNTTMKGEDQTEIAELEEEVANSMTEENIQELKTRLVNIRTQYQNVINAIDSIKYGNKKVAEISSYSVFKTQADRVLSSSSIPYQNGNLNSYKSSTFSSLYSSSVDSLSVSTADNYNPVINPITGEVDTPELFVTWYSDEVFGAPRSSVTEAVEEAESEKEDAQNQADEKEENATKGRYTGGGSDITVDFSPSETSFSFLSGSLSGITTLMESIVNLDLTDLRDDLYVTTYMMEMFSYATYENEGYYSLLSDDVKTSLTLSNYEEKYEQKKGSESEAGSWLSSSTTDTYNKSLTNHLINSSNNVAYEAEIEYILYGGTNAENVKKAYDTIYGIRYILNLVSGFANFWSGTNMTARAISSVASAISVATYGVVPATLIKVVLIAILTVFETSNDLDRMEAGFPVEIYKSTDDWWFSFANEKQSIGSAMPPSVSNGSNKDQGIYYSDYLSLFVYLGLTDDSSAEGMYLRMAEVIQTNMRKLTGKDTYSMSKALLYFQLDAEVRVTPLMITLPYFNEYENDLQTNTDWCTYKVSIIRGY